MIACPSLFTSVYANEIAAPLKEHAQSMSRSNSVSLRLPSAGRQVGPIVRRTLHDEVAESLRNMIVENELTPGERIDEKRLCALFGISRTPLREALKVLASEGLVDLMPNRGARISRITSREVEEIFEVASGLERLAAELAAERATDEEIEELRATHERMVQLYKAGRRSDYFRLNQRIHNGVIALTRNTVLIDTHADLMTRIRRARYMAIMSQERWDESVREHEDLIEALEARDGVKAGTVLRAHVKKTGEIVSSVIETDPQDHIPADNGA